MYVLNLLLEYFVLELKFQKVNIIMFALHFLFDHLAFMLEFGYFIPLLLKHLQMIGPLTKRRRLIVLKKEFLKFSDFLILPVNFILMLVIIC